MRVFQLNYHNPHKIERAVYLFKAEPPIPEGGYVYGDFEEIEGVLRKYWRNGDRMVVGELRKESRRHELKFLTDLFGKDNLKFNNS